MQFRIFILCRHFYVNLLLPDQLEPPSLGHQKTNALELLKLIRK